MSLFGTNKRRSVWIDFIESQQQLAREYERDRNNFDRGYAVGFLAGMRYSNKAEPYSQGQSDAEPIGPQGDNRDTQTSQETEDDGLGPRG